MDKLCFYSKLRVPKLTILVMVILFILIVVIDSSFLQFVISLIFCWIALKIYFKRKSKINKIEINKDKVILYDEVGAIKMNAIIGSVHFEFISNGMFYLDDGKNRFYVDIGEEVLKFKNMLKKHKIVDENRRKNKWSFSDILDLLYIIK